MSTNETTLESLMPVLRKCFDDSLNNLCFSGQAEGCQQCPQCLIDVLVVEVQRPHKCTQKLALIQSANQFADLGLAQLRICPQETRSLSETTSIKRVEQTKCKEQ